MDTRKKRKPYKGKVYRSETKKPWDAGWWGKGKYFSEQWEYARQYGKPKSYDIEIENPYYAEEQGKDIEKIGLEIWDKLIPKEESVLARDIEELSKQRQEAMSKHIRERLEKMGYDGVVVQRGPFKEVVAFHPETQVKPVIREEKEQGGLERKFFSIMVIGVFVISIFFLLPNLTGNTISNLTNQTSNIIGGVLLAVGIIGVYLCFKG